MEDKWDRTSPAIGGCDPERGIHTCTMFESLRTTGRAFPWLPFDDPRNVNGRRLWLPQVRSITWVKGGIDD